MTSAPKWIPSKRMQAAARSERRRIEREIEKVKKQEVRYQRELARANQKRSQLHEELSAIMRFADEEASTNGGPQLRVVAYSEADTNDLVLKGAQIREFAVNLVVRTRYADEGIHYRTWFDLVSAQGVKLTGKDPVATFLTQISRSPVVMRSEKPGVYLIDFTFPDNAKARIHELEQILDSAADGDPEASIDEIEAQRVAQRKAKTEVRTLRRAIQEADRSLRSADMVADNEEAVGSRSDTAVSPGRLRQESASSEAKYQLMCRRRGGACVRLCRYQR